MSNCTDKTNTKPQRIIIAGGTGFLGLNLAHHLENPQRQIILISRHPPKHPGPWIHEKWDGRTLDNQWVTHLENATALINLAGRSVDCIKTPHHCDEILRSRVEATQVLGEALNQTKSPPPVWIQMSTAHCYGDPPQITCHEDSHFGYGLAPHVATAWEKAHTQSIPPNTRSVILRTSFVLGRHGGALPRLAKLTRFGLGGKVGHGQQGISWIHQTDMNRLFAHAISNEQMTGAYLATAPNPVSNGQFMQALRKTLRIPLGLPAAAWMVRIGAPLIMNTDPELALYGRYCISIRLQDEKFQFKFPDLPTALQDIYRKT